MVIIQKFQANNHLAVIFPLVVASAVFNCETSAPLSSQAWQKITDPPLLRPRERSVAIHYSSSRYRKSLDCTAAVSLLAVTEYKKLLSL